MMSLTRLWLISLSLLFSACASSPEIPILGDHAPGEERRILVTFVDRTINRHITGNALETYQTSGRYNNSSWSERTARTLAKRHHLQFVAQWPVTELGVSCVVYQVPIEQSLDNTLLTLQNDQDVSLAQRMHSFQVLSDEQEANSKHSDPYVSLQTGFNSLGIAELHRFANGKGVRIALIDTGVDTDHPDLKGQIEMIENLAPEIANHSSAEIHGTAVAGVIAAKSNNGVGIAGIAPEAELLAYRACWPEKPGAIAARCNSFTLALALNKAIQMRAQIINLSLTGPEDPLLRRLIEKAIAKNIAIVAAVPGKRQSGGFPANIPGVMAVSQISDANKATIVAPGIDILTTVPNQAYDFMTGSSFAAPHVAGIIALILQVYPDSSVTEIRRLLIEDANPMGVLRAKLENQVNKLQPASIVGKLSYKPGS